MVGHDDYLPTPAVACNGTKYLVAWLQRDYTWKLNGVFIDSNGSFDAANIFTLASPQSQTTLSLTADGDNYWLCYLKNRRLFVREIFATGELGKEHSIVIIGEWLEKVKITALPNTGKLLVTWVQSDLVALHFLEKVKAVLLNTADSMEVEASYTFSVQNNEYSIASVAAATDGNMFCIAWSDERDTIRAAILLADGSLLYKKAFTIAHNEDGVSHPTIASRKSGEFLIAYDKVDLSPEFKVRRIRARRLRLTTSDYQLKE